jgi:hypothetical protein
MDAARAPQGHGCPFGAGPRSVAGVREFRRRRNPTRSKHPWLLGVLFQVTRRRRNRSGVSQSPICLAAITWRMQISSCTRSPVGAVRQPGPRSDDRGRSGDSFATDPPPRCRRGLRRLPQELGQDRQLCSLLILILILLLSARYPRRHRSRLGCRLNAGDVEWAERHGCRESAVRTWMSVRRGPTERRRSEGIPTKEEPNQEQAPLVTWGAFPSNSPKAKQAWR